MSRETLEVPLPKDVKIKGGRRHQTPRDQLLMMGFGVILLLLAYSGAAGELNAILWVIGGFTVGVSFERLQWMIYGKYGTWRDAAKRLLQFGGDSDGA